MILIELWMLSMVLIIGAHQGSSTDVPSVLFSNEPPNKVEFLNTKGKNINCEATGTPSPNIHWILIDGTTVTNVSGLREVTPTGILVFHSFRAENFRPDIHSATYRCVASSTAGTIHSRDIIVRGVVLQNLDVQVYDAYAIEGNTAVFKCYIPTIQDDYVKVTAWIKNDNMQIQPVMEDTNNKYAIFPSGELHIRNATLEESGSRYKCKTNHILSGEDKLSSTAGQLFVTKSAGSVPPSILVSPSSFNVRSEQTAALPCVSQGNPVPTTKWLKKTVTGNLEPVISTNGHNILAESALVIHEAVPNDSGTYTCEVSNDIGTERREIVLCVTERISATIQLPVRMVKVGDSASLKCEVKGQTASPIIWLHDGSELETTGDTLTIDSIKPSDRGLYQCVVKNSLGEVAQATAELRLSEIEPQFVKTFEEIAVHPGSSVEVSCSAQGIPLPTLYWDIDGTQIMNSSRLQITSAVNNDGNVVSILKINKVNVEDGGVYSCVSTNNAGESTFSARINVYGPLGSRQQQDKIAVSGSNIALNCPVYGYPIQEVIWEKDGQTVPFIIQQQLYANGTLIIAGASRTSDSGIYKCTASDGAGKYSEAKVHLEIMVRPKIVPFEFQDELLREGMRARLQCVVSEGDLPLNVTWLKDGKPLQSSLGIPVRVLDEFSSILTISSITPSHNGKYTCVASNRAATVTHSAELSVNVKPKIVPFHFGDLLYEGSAARVVCGLQEGDAPIQFSWLHNGALIKPNKLFHVQEVDGLSSILSFGKLSANHSGAYTCNAENGAGVAQYEALLKVNVPPKIVPFKFQDDHLVEGLLARVSCVVSRGDLPLKLQWEKDGAGVISGNLGIQIRSFDEHSSVLSIPAVSSVHNGVYTCIASNAAGTARHSDQLVAKVPPRWIIKPENVAAKAGEDIMLPCQADGFPKPEITWMQAKDAKHNSVRNKLHSHNGIQIFTNGTLLIKKISPVYEGYYFCQVSNGVGYGLSAVVKVEINAPPSFKMSASKVEGSINKDVQLQCLAQGDTPIKIVWSKDEKVIQEVQSRHKIQMTNTASDAVSILTITKLQDQDSGIYVCSAENKHGTNRTTIHLIVKGVPQAPLDIKVASVNSRSVELAWQSPADGNDPIKKYIIQFKRAEESWESAITMETVNGVPTNSIVSQLHPSTDYLFRLYAENSLGRSETSHILRVTTHEDEPSGPPTNVQVESINTETIKVMWKAPDEKLWNGKVLGFYVGYKEVDTEDPYLFKTLLTPNPHEEHLAVQIGGLKQFTKYAVIVQAYNGKGKGPQSEPVVIMTSEGAPNLAPTDVRCTTLTSQSMHVAWTAPPSDSINGILRGYKVLYKPASDWFDDLAESFSVTLSESVTLDKLDKFSNYSIEVLATTKAGNGPKTSAIFCKTQDDVPGQPMNIKAIATSDDSVIVAWKPPENANGIIRTYSIYWKNSSKRKNEMHTVPARESSYEVTGLRKGQRYEFWVTASTLVGEGEASRIVSQTPSGPTVAAKMVSFDEKIISPWKSDISLLCQAVGLPEPTRIWQWKGKPIISSRNLEVSNDGTLVIKDIEEDNGGDYTCQVKNELGEDKVTYSIIVLAPPAAPIVEVRSVTANSVEVHWRTPASKSSRIKGYTLHMRSDVSEWKETTVGSDVRNYLLNTLDCGTRYEIFMTAFNKIGTGAASQILTVSTNGSVPAPPSKSDLIEETSTSVSLYLNTWKSNGCPIHNFYVEYAPKGSNEWTYVTSSIKPEQRRVAIPGLKPGTWYELRMTAHNSAGSAVAEYNFATLTVTGATISPETQSDSANEAVDGLIAYLNFYVVIPICCTIIILLAILAAACFYLKMRSKPQREVMDDNRMSTMSTQLKRGDSTGSFSYLQRGTLNQQTHSKYVDDDLTPYATCQLVRHSGMMDTMGHRGMAPPLPPPRNEGFHGSNPAPANPHFFIQSGGFPPLQNTTETTFIFPNLPLDDGIHGSSNFGHGYPPEVMRMPHH